MRVISKFLVVLFLVSMLHSGYSQNNPVPWPFREKLTYKVSWSFIRLGTLKFVIQDTLRMNGRRVYHAKLFIDSNPFGETTLIEDDSDCCLKTEIPVYVPHHIELSGSIAIQLTSLFISPSCHV